MKYFLLEISLRSFHKYTWEKQEGWEKQQMICQDWRKHISFSLLKKKKNNNKKINKPSMNENQEKTITENLDIETIKQSVK